MQQSPNDDSLLNGLGTSDLDAILSDRSKKTAQMQQFDLFTPTSERAMLNFTVGQNDSNLALLISNQSEGQCIEILSSQEEQQNNRHGQAIQGSQSVIEIESGDIQDQEMIDFSLPQVDQPIGLLDESQFIINNIDQIMDVDTPSPNQRTPQPLRQHGGISQNLGFVNFSGQQKSAKKDRTFMDQFRQSREQSVGAEIIEAEEIDALDIEDDEINLENIDDIQLSESDKAASVEEDIDDQDLEQLISEGSYRDGEQNLEAALSATHIPNPGLDDESFLGEHDLEEFLPDQDEINQNAQIQQNQNFLDIPNNIEKDQNLASKNTNVSENLIPSFSEISEFQQNRRTFSPKRFQSNKYEIFQKIDKILALPPNLKFVYVDDLKVTGLFDWQTECLSTPAISEKGGFQNLIYSAPTSAGKTIVGELLMLSKLWTSKLKHIKNEKLQQQTQNPLAMVIMPFVSLIGEKELRLKKILREMKIDTELGPNKMVMASIFGGKRSQVNMQTNLALCTIEKASQLLNYLLSDEEQISRLQTIVIDELHLIGDPQRGHMIETILTKLKYLAEVKQIKVQIIAMSATFPNLNEISEWIGGTCYTSTFRPIEIKEYAKVGNKVFNKSGEIEREIANPKENGDWLGILPLIMETIGQGKQAIVFCSTKVNCEKYCEKFFSKINAAPKKEKIEKFRDNFATANLFKYVQKGGIGYHHSGLQVLERQTIEDFFKNGIIKVIFCTSTLAAGVNLPAKRVIIAGLKQGISVLSSITYKQMVGRAGRYGLDTEADSYLCVPTSSSDRQQVMSLVQKDQMDYIKSSFSNEKQGLSRIILDSIGTGLVRDCHDLQAYIEGTLMFKQELEKQKSMMDHKLKQQPTSKSARQSQNAGSETQQEEDAKEEARKTVETHGKRALDFLRYNEIIQQKEEDNSNRTFTLTKLGEGILEANQSPEEGLLIYLDLKKANSQIVLSNELHLLYLISPISLQFKVQWQSFQRWYRNLEPIEEQIAKLIGVDEDSIARHGQQEQESMHYGGLKSRNVHFERKVVMVQKQPLPEQRENNIDPVDAEVPYSQYVTEPISHLTRHKNPEVENSSMVEFEAFAEQNSYMIEKLRHIRFYTTLLLKDMLDDSNSFEAISKFYEISLSDLNSFKERCSIYSSVVVRLCKQLNWWNLHNLLSQYMDRINFTIQDELSELVEELHEVGLDSRKARAIYEQGYSTVYAISKAKPISIMTALQRTLVVSRQFNANNEDLYMKSAQQLNGLDHSFATLSNAEKIINGAKRVMKRRYLQKAREAIVNNIRKRQEDAIMQGIQNERQKYVQIIQNKRKTL